LISFNAKNSADIIRCCHYNSPSRKRVHSNFDVS